MGGSGYVSGGIPWQGRDGRVSGHVSRTPNAAILTASRGPETEKGEDVWFGLAMPASPAPTMAVTASYMARCNSAKVIGVRNGTISLAAAACEAAPLHAAMTSGVAAEDGRADAARMTTAMSHAAMRATSMYLIGALQCTSVILTMPASDSSAPGLPGNPILLGTE